MFYSPAFNMWVVTRYSDARAVLGRPTIFSSRRTIDPIVEIAPAAYAVLASGPPVIPVLVNSDPPDHARFRRVLNRAFSPPRMRLLEPEIQEITHAHIDAIEPLGRTDAMQTLAFPIPVRVIARLLDVEDEPCRPAGTVGSKLDRPHLLGHGFRAAGGRGNGRGASPTVHGRPPPAQANRAG